MIDKTNGMIEAVMALLDAEIERVRRTDDIKGDEWREWRHKAFHEGVRIAREVSEQRLRQIKNALIESQSSRDK